MEVIWLNPRAIAVTAPREDERDFRELARRAFAKIGLCPKKMEVRAYITDSRVLLFAEEKDAVTIN